MAKNGSGQKTVVFIDTNVYLDFYRNSSDATVRTLTRLEDIRSKIMCTYQVEMEFLKNRQSVIKKTMDEIKGIPKLSIPAVLNSVPLSFLAGQAVDNAKDYVEKLHQRFYGLLDEPDSNDIVYRALENVFRSGANCVLRRDMPIRGRIKRLAWRRFILGYPPRNDDDTSIGDAINWEWIIEYANESRDNVVVSRDGDFGLVTKNKCYLNDELKMEFEERVGSGVSIVLTNRLTKALKDLDVDVPDEEVEAEVESIDANRGDSNDSPLTPNERRVRALVDEVNEQRPGHGFDEPTLRMIARKIIGTEFEGE